MNLLHELTTFLPFYRNLFWSQPSLRALNANSRTCSFTWPPTSERCQLCCLECLVKPEEPQSGTEPMGATWTFVLEQSVWVVFKNVSMKHMNALRRAFIHVHMFLSMYFSICWWLRSFLQICQLHIKAFNPPPSARSPECSSGFRPGHMGGQETLVQLSWSWNHSDLTIV